MSESPDANNVDVVHEESDVNVAAILHYGLGLAVVALVAHVFLWWLLGVYERQNERAAAPRRTQCNKPTPGRVFLPEMLASWRVLGFNLNKLC